MNGVPYILLSTEFVSYLEDETEEFQATLIYDVVQMISRDIKPDFSDDRHKRFSISGIWRKLIDKYAQESLEARAKYELRCNTNKENGKRGGAPKGNQNARRDNGDGSADDEADGETSDPEPPPDAADGLNPDTKSAFSDYTYGDICRICKDKKLSYLSPPDVWQKLEASQGRDQNGQKIGNLDGYLVQCNKNAKEEADEDAATFADDGRYPTEAEFVEYAAQFVEFPVYSVKEAYRKFKGNGFHNKSGHKIANWRLEVQKIAKEYRKMRTREGVLAYCRRNKLNVNVQSFLAECESANWLYPNTRAVIDPHKRLKELSDSNNKQGVNARDFSLN